MTQDAQAQYWRMRLAAVGQALEKNNFGVHQAADPAMAREIVLRELLPRIAPRSASWGDSMTLAATGLLEELRRRPQLKLIETFAEGVPRPELLERRRQALNVDLFFTGTNAVTEAGQLVNLDMVGNRVGGIVFGPRHVVLFIGRNKIVADVNAAMERIKNYAAPANAIRHPKFKTPCQKTARCMDCASPDRICNTWVITEKSFPKGRIQVVLIDQDLGL